MINVSLENETDWIVKGTVTSDVSEINLEDDEFRIELKDLLEHYVKRNKSSDMVESYQKDSTQTLSISNNEVKLVPLKCPVCKGTGLASNTYPPGRSINNTTYKNGIIEVNNSVFFNPIIQLSDYDKLPETYYPEGYLDEFYPNLSDDVKTILTYPDDEPDKPDCEHALYKQIIPLKKDKNIVLLLMLQQKYYLHNYHFLNKSNTTMVFVVKKFGIKKIIQHTITTIP